MELRTETVLASLEMSEVKSDGGSSEGDEDYESLPAHASLCTHMTAGAVAGVLEHTVMYPVDSVKVTPRRQQGVKTFTRVSSVLLVALDSSCEVAVKLTFKTKL